MKASTGFSAIAAIVILALVVLSANLNPLFPIDDAYTSFRYARNWAEGVGLMFNAGERVEAESNFLWTMLVGFLRLAGLTEPLGARILAWFAVALTSALILWIIRRRLPSSPPALAVAVSVAYLLLPGTSFHALSGMETVLTGLLLLAAAAVLDADFPVGKRSWLLGLILALVSLNRPEGILLFGLVFSAAAAVTVLRPEERATKLLPLVLSFAAIMTPFLIWRVAYYGSLVPNSVVAKGGTYSLAILKTGVEYGLRFVVSYSPLLILAAVSFATARLTGLLYLRLPLVLTYGTLVVLGGIGDGYPFSRYLYPLVPLLLVWAMEGFWDIVRMFERDPARTKDQDEDQDQGPGLRSGKKAAWVPGLLVLFVVAVCQSALSRAELKTSGLPFGMDDSGPRADLARFFAQDRAPHDTAGPLRIGLGHHLLAAWLQAHASPEQLLATHEIGIVPYYSRLPVLDLYGLASREIALSEGPPGQRAKPAYVASRRPDYLVLRLPADSLSMPLPIFSDDHRREDYAVIQQFPYGNTQILLFKRREGK